MPAHDATRRPATTRERRVMGAVVGSATGDALGAPFEFRPAMSFSARFPAGTGTVEEQMCGGGMWKAGEATDDTQMAIVVAESLLDNGGLDGADMFRRFQRWSVGGPKDIGVQTSAVLESLLPWDEAAEAYFRRTGRAAGNGSLMRTAPAAVFYARAGRAATMDAARRISALTHGDPAAGEGCAIYHEMIRVALDGGDPLAAVDTALAAVAPARRDRWATVLDPGWHPREATERNGAVWPALGSAVWAVRTTTTFPDAMRAAIDLGHDTDTVAAITGGLAGAGYGIDAIPAGWTRRLFVPLPGFGSVWREPDLRQLALRLDAAGATPGSP